MRPASGPPHILTLILATTLAVLTLNTFLPSLAHIGADFSANYAVVNLSISGYLIATAVLQLIMGPLSDRYGRRPVLLVSMVIFVAASVGCVMAQSIWVFLGFRLLQGAVIAGQVLSGAAI